MAAQNPSRLGLFTATKWIPQLRVLAVRIYMSRPSPGSAHKPRHCTKYIYRLYFVSDRKRLEAVADANMRLYLSTRKPWDSVYTTEDGQAIYKTTTPWKICERKTSIERIVPSQEIENMRDEFAHLAEVDYGVFSSSHIRYAGQDLVTRDFFRKGAR